MAGLRILDGSKILRGGKVSVSVRLDPGVRWVRSGREGQLTRIDDILTNLKQAECLAGSGAADGERGK